MRVHASEYTATIAKIARINTRAAKRGFTGRITVEGTPTTWVETTETGLQATHVGFDVTLGGEAPCYGGYQFLATLDWDNGTLVTRCAPGFDGVIDRSALVEGHCDHCKVNRYRTVTYLVRETATGVTTQVGSTCIKDFLGWTGSIVFYTVDDLEREINEGAQQSYDPSYAVETVLAVALACIRTYGWVPASDDTDQPTKFVVSAVFAPRSDYDREVADVIVPKVNAAEGEAVRAYILSDAFSGNNEYVENLKAICGATYVTARNFGLLASAPQAWIRYVERAAANAANPSEFIGTLGEKIEFTGTITSIRYIAGAYGTTNLYTITSAEGNVVKWFASRTALGTDTDVTVTITGSVKKHETYQGKRSTVLTRCKVPTTV